VNDTDPAVREASFEALGMAMKVVTEKHVMPFLTDVDSIKMQKVTQTPFISSLVMFYFSFYRERGSSVYYCFYHAVLLCSLQKIFV
jgi:hypothetical protein